MLLIDVIITLFKQWGKLPQNFISSRNRPVKVQKKANMNTCKKTTLEWKDGRKERQEDYPTSVAYACTVDIG